MTVYAGRGKTPEEMREEIYAEHRAEERERRIQNGEVPGIHTKTFKGGTRDLMPKSDRWINEMLEKYETFEIVDITLYPTPFVIYRYVTYAISEDDPGMDWYFED